MRIANAMTSGLLDIQHGALQGRNTTTLATNLLNDMHTQDGYVPLLDVAKAFPSVPRSMLTNIVKDAGAPESIIRMRGKYTNILQPYCPCADGTFPYVPLGE